MSSFRVVLRWTLTLLAAGLVILALLLSGLRLAASQIDVLRDELSAFVARQINANLELQSLNGGWRGVDPALGFDDLRLLSGIGADAVPLLEIEQARLHIDSLASLRAGYPVTSDTRISNARLHLYQDRHGRWRWPEPVALPPGFIPDTEFEIEGFDRVADLLLHQQAVVDDFQLVLHGTDDSLTLVAPRLLMASDSRRAHVEGQLFVEGVPESSLEAVLEALPGRTRRSDVDASLQVRADLGSLSRLGQILTRQWHTRLDRLSGEAELWGRWRDGRLEDARTHVAVPELTLSSAGGPLTLHDIGAQAQWLRGEEDAWQAWVNPLTISEDPGGDSPLPERLYLVGDDRGWLARSSPFDIAVLAGWGERLPLDDALRRGLEALSPAGEISGLEAGWRQGSWHARAALQGMTVSPWLGAPGGGPLDAWIEAQDGQGQVAFVGQPGGTQLALPRIFPSPLTLAHASGEVEWTLADGGLAVASDDLTVDWQGAAASGGFRLALPGASASAASGEFELSLEMTDIDAIDTPLVEWLPVGILDAELQQWLAGGMAGRVPQGSLYVRQRLDGDETTADGELRLELRVEEGRLPYDPQWPSLENVRGNLLLEDERLHATVEHAETQGLISEGADVTLENERLTVNAPVQGTTQSLLSFLAASPIEGMDVFADWQSVGDVAGTLALDIPMADPDALEIDVQASVDAPRLTFPGAELTLGSVNGNLHYQHAGEVDTLTGTLGARAFDGPLLANFDIGGKGVALEGRALARGLLDWAGLDGVEGLLAGYFPYSAQLDLASEEPRLVVDSDLQGLAILLPAPFGKRLDERVPLHVEAIPGQRLNAELADRMRLRWRVHGPDGSQGQAWLERWPASPEWPSGAGWEFAWQTPQLHLAQWQAVLAGLAPGDATAGAAPDEASSALRRATLVTACLEWQQRCLGSLDASARPFPQGWRFDLAGSLVEGQAEYRPARSRPVSIALSRLSLDALLADAPRTTPSLASEIATMTVPEPAALPGGLNKLPDGLIEVSSVLYQGRPSGPLAASWDASPQRLSIDPLSFTLGEVTAAGELVWEASGPQASLTRSRIELSGGDIGTLFEMLGQPVALRTEETAVQTQLAWPGAPWQFALERSRGNVKVALSDGRFLALDSPPARLVGLLNIDNLLRRLRLDFSDVTRRGTAFNSVSGEATLYGGRLETRGPIEINGTSTQFSLDGSVDLAARQLNLLLGVTVPVSQNLPLAAVLVGAPYIGGALFLADKVFGGWIDKVTRIHYRVRGPWTSPQITLENAE